MKRRDASRDWERELKKKAGEHDPKYPRTSREYKRWIKELSKKYGVPAWQIENTIREVGVEETLRRLEASKEAPRKRGFFEGLKELLGKLRRP
ncbi:MAG: hypothetical protein QXS00_07925 [Pyrobaculum sp.]